ncbi:hypothetical protein WBG78_04415 [Chryseolinea sp. T2]|uniref:hypothetical protein n=1 Tax=Chryseolinea sp. T2 TaxID=3129255 RepID=UPI00307726AF
MLRGVISTAFSSTILYLMCALLVTSCDRMKQKADGLSDRIKNKAARQVEKVFPTFDAYTPDTENNRKRFRDFLKIEPSPDVKNLYCFDDAIGIDQDYMFAFDCNAVTSAAIIKFNVLQIDTANMDNGFGMQHDFDWWDKNHIASLQKLAWTDGHGHFKYYWYDDKSGKAYFFDFDM